MNPERKAQLQVLRQRLASLSEGERQAIAAQGVVLTVEGRQLSLHNTLLCCVQAVGGRPTVVGGYRQWQAAGRQVQRGEHGMTIWFPSGAKDTDEDNEGDQELHFLLGTVFDVSQTAPITKAG